MCFNVLLPVINFLIFYLAVGRPPSGLMLSYTVENMNNMTDMTDMTNMTNMTSKTNMTSQTPTLQCDQTACSSTLHIVSYSCAKIELKIFDFHHFQKSFKASIRLSPS